MLDAIKAEEDLHLLWTHSAAPSAMLLLPGQALAAVADVPHVAADGDHVVMTLDLVHNPHTFSELVKHGVQQHNSAAHYHFYTPAGVEVDAAKCLARMKQVSFEPPGEQ